MSLYYTEKTDNYSGGQAKVVNIVLTFSGLFIFIIGIWMAFHPIYSVWSAKKAGEAEYAQADQNRQITIVEAQAANEAATSKALATIKIAQAEAQAEVERAKGVAQANAIIGDSLKGNEDYLRYLYITGLTGKASQIIYVPTEAGLPILEAGKRNYGKSFLSRFRQRQKSCKPAKNKKSQAGCPAGLYGR